MEGSIIDQRVTDSGFELASVLLAAWNLADAALRADLEQLIRGYVRRNPAFRRDLERVVTFNERARALGPSVSNSAQMQQELTRLYQQISNEFAQSASSKQES